MSTDEMRAVLIKIYGNYIRGRSVQSMSDHQIYCIYSKVAHKIEKQLYEQRVEPVYRQQSIFDYI